MPIFSIVWNFADVGERTEVIEVETREQLIAHLSSGLHSASAYEEHEFTEEEIVDTKFYESPTSQSRVCRTEEEDSILGWAHLDEEESFLDMIIVTKIVLPTEGSKSHWSRGEYFE